MEIQAGEQTVNAYINIQQHDIEVRRDIDFWDPRVWGIDRLHHHQTR